MERGLDLPTQFTRPDLSFLNANDTIQSSIDPSKISYVGEFSALQHSPYLTRAIRYHRGKAASPLA